MIPRITRGSSAAAALAYDFGPGRREEHVDARTVAGTVPGDWRAQAALIDATVAAKPRVEKGIWRTSLRAAPQDRVLTDAEWGAIADRYVAEMGVGGHPWTATRHGDDHIHLTVSRVSWTGTVVALHRDFPKAQAACRAIEAEHHLIDASQRFDKTRPQVVHGEREYAARRGLVPEREQLRALVGAVTSAAAGDVAQRVAAERAHLTSAVTQGRAPGQGQSPAGAAADLRGAFEARLNSAGVVYRANVASTGKVSGYSYGLAGHTDAAGEQVFFKGSQLGKDHSWAATTRALKAGVARGVAQHLTRTQQVDRHMGQQSGERADHRTGRDAVAGRAAQDQPAQAPATQAASIDIQLERVREARRQRAAASAERSAEQGIEQGVGQSRELLSGLSDAQAFQQALQRFRGQFGHSARQQPGGQPNREPGRDPVQPAAPRQASPDQRPDQRPDQQGDRSDKERNTRRPGELVSGPQREQLRAQHEAVKARTAELQRAARAAESSYDQAKQALTTAQRDLRAALDDRSVASGWVVQARGEVTRAASDLEALRAQVAGRSWLGRARQQLAEDWGSVTGGRAGAPRDQVQAQVAAAQERLVVAEQYLGGRQRVLEGVEARVSAARGRVAQAESAVPATRLVANRAQVAYSQAVMRPTEYEQLTYREYLAANPEVARRRQEELDPTSALNRTRRRDRSPGPGRDPDRGRGFGR